MPKLDLVQLYFMFSEKAFDIIFSSTFNKEMRVQFCMTLISIILMIACLWDVINPLSASFAPI